MAKKTEPDQPAVVMVEALVPMWGDTDVVPIGFRYHLPVETAEYLAGHLAAAGFVQGTVDAHDWQLFAKVVKGAADGEEN